MLDHFVAGFDWFVPSGVDIDERGFLFWREPRDPLMRVHPGPGILEDFLKLVRQPDKSVLEYARHWGPLWLCEHGAPWRQHQRDCDRGESDDVNDDAGESDDEWWWERASDWRAIATEAAATIRIARQLYAGRVARLADWDAAVSLGCAEGGAYSGARAIYQDAG
ncbi:MAG: hypothetical protein JOZ81_18105 [Chloroflexi bacterium]|nr:hypothetical protein [Chloroflexota bacterium]